LIEPRPPETFRDCIRLWAERRPDLGNIYAAAPTIRLPELIELFANRSLKALAGAIMESPEQFAFVLKFQQKKFLETLPEEQKAAFEAILAPIINNNFNGIP
jgi:haloalkane dehalogenase